MPHQCLKCGKIYDNKSDVIINGCPNCGAKLFLFIKKRPLEEREIELTKQQKELILKEVEDLSEFRDPEQPVIFKLENIRIVGSGKYEIDINQLMKKRKPLIYKIQDGTYVIDLSYIADKSSRYENG